jgi:hypothetical protein
LLLQNVGHGYQPLCEGLVHKFRAVYAFPELEATNSLLERRGKEALHRRTLNQNLAGTPLCVCGCRSMPLPGGFTLQGLLLTLYVVGVANHGVLRQIVQTLPLWVPIVLGFRGSEFAK